MEPFTLHIGKAAVLPWSDVNTDLIIPARYLKRIERGGYGPFFFADKRYLPGSAPPPENPGKPGKLDPSFPLNSPENEGASILMVGRNFGCGSSREHAVWAVHQAGFRALIAPGVGEGFADIFEGNAYQNGLLPIEIPEERWQTLRECVEKDPRRKIFIDLNEQTIIVPPGLGGALRVVFETPPEERERLLAGADGIAVTLERHGKQIETFEKKAPAWLEPGTGTV